MNYSMTICSTIDKEPYWYGGGLHVFQGVCCKRLRVQHISLLCFAYFYFLSMFFSFNVVFQHAVSANHTLWQITTVIAMLSFWLPFA